MSSSETIHRGRKRTRNEKSWNRNIAKQSRNQVHILHHIINVYYNCRGLYKQLIKLTMIYYILDFEEFEFFLLQSLFNCTITLFIVFSTTFFQF